MTLSPFHQAHRDSPELARSESRTIGVSSATKRTVRSSRPPPSLCPGLEERLLDMGRSRRLDLSLPYTPTRYSSGYGLRIAQDQSQQPQTLGGHAQYPAPTQIAPPENADEGWITPMEDAGYETPKPSQSVELPPTPPAKEEEEVAFPPTHGNAYIPWIPVRYKDEELNNPKPISTQELLAGFGRMTFRDVPPHRSGFGTSNFDRTGDGPDTAEGGWGAQRNAEAGAGWNTASGFEGGRRGCFECGEDGHMVRECPVRASQGGGGGGGGYGGNGGNGGISKFGAGNECRRCGQEGHWAKECPGESGYQCYNCGEAGHMSRDCSEPHKALGGGMNTKCFNCQAYGHMSRECPATQGGPRGSGRIDNDEDWGFKVSGGAGDDEGWGTSTMPEPASQVDSQHEAPVFPTGHGDHFDTPAHVLAPEPVGPRAPFGMHPDRARRLGVPVVPQDDPRYASHGPVQQSQRQPTTAVRPPPAPAAAPAEDNEFGGW